MPSQIRALFVNILLNADTKEPHVLWEKHKLAMCEDFLHTARLAAHDNNLPLATSHEDQALSIMQHMLQQHGHSLDNYQIRIPTTHPTLARGVSQLILDQRNYDRATLSARVLLEVPMLNAAQLRTFNAIKAARISPPTGRARCFFIDGQGKMSSGASILHNI
jgi:hypothetical protein